MPTEELNLTPGEILAGKVQGVTNFGAFVELAPNVVGLVHISEIADTYVKEVKNFINEGDEVKVKVLSVAGKKIGLSIKQALPPTAAPARPPRPEKAPPRRDNFSGGSNAGFNKRRDFAPAAVREKSADVTPPNLDDKIARFLKESEERMQPLKNKYEHKKKNRY